MGNWHMCMCVWVAGTKNMARKQLVEIKNGRLAMLAVSGDIFISMSTHTPPIYESAHAYWTNIYMSTHTHSEVSPSFAWNNAFACWTWFEPIFVLTLDACNPFLIVCRFVFWSRTIRHLLPHFCSSTAHMSVGRFTNAIKSCHTYEWNTHLNRMRHVCACGIMTIGCVLIESRPAVWMGHVWQMEESYHSVFKW